MKFFYKQFSKETPQRFCKNSKIWGPSASSQLAYKKSDKNRFTYTLLTNLAIYGKNLKTR